MAQQTLNVGSNANDGTGDTLRAAMQKVNTMFTEVYASSLFNDSISLVGNEIQQHVQMTILLLDLLVQEQ